MTIINPKSITGVTSITTPSGSDNLFTVHTNNTTERIRINNDGDVIVGSGITVSPDGDIFATGVTTSTTFVGALTGNVTGNISGGTVAGSTGTFTGDVDIADKIVHTGDTDTAIRFSGADTITAETGGSERLRIDSSGKVGIRNTSMSSFNGGGDDLVIGDGTDGAGAGITLLSHSTDNCSIFFNDTASSGVTGLLQYRHDSDAMLFSTASSERMRIDSSGRLLIGFDSSFSADGNNTALQVCGTSSDPSSAFFGRFANNSSGPFLMLAKSRNGTVGGNTVLQADDTLGTIVFYGNDGSGFHEGARIQAIVESGVGNDDIPTALTFKVNTGTTSVSEKMRIDSSGRLLLGTTDVGASGVDNLIVNVPSGNGGMTIRSGSSNNGNIFFSDGTSGAAEYAGYFQYQHASNALVIGANGSERARITNTGTLFLGVTSEPGQGDAGAQISNTSYSVFARQTSGSSVFRAWGNDGEFRSLGNGNAQNTNNSYGGTSDRELKENEVDANSQWDDIKALQIKNYNFKTSPDVKHLGVIAQDLEASGMNGLVENNPDELYAADDVLPEGKNIGDVKEKMYKTVKYSVLYMKSVKALQEAIAKIEVLETRLNNAGIAT